MEIYYQPRVNFKNMHKEIEQSLAKLIEVAPTNLQDDIAKIEGYIYGLEQALSTKE